MNTQLGAVSGSMVEVTHRMPLPEPPVDQPGGSAGAVTPSKFSAKIMLPHGVAEGAGVTVGVGVGVDVDVGVGVGLGVRVGVAVAVALGVGVGVAGGVVVALGVGVGVAPVQTSGEGPWIPTVTGVPVLKKPIVAFTACGGRSESKRKLYIVPYRIAFAFGFCARVSVFQLRSLAVWFEVQAALLNPVLPTVPSFGNPG